MPALVDTLHSEAGLDPHNAHYTGISIPHRSPFQSGFHNLHAHCPRSIPAAIVYTTCNLPSPLLSSTRIPSALVASGPHFHSTRLSSPAHIASHIAPLHWVVVVIFITVSFSVSYHIVTSGFALSIDVLHASHCISHASHADTRRSRTRRIPCKASDLDIFIPPVFPHKTCTIACMRRTGCVH